eukprot:564995-Alexandrium_andersonii.AAC.1
MSGYPDARKPGWGECGTRKSALLRITLRARAACKRSYVAIVLDADSVAFCLTAQGEDQTMDNAR